MHCSNSSSCNITPRSSTTDQPPSDTPSGTNAGREVIAHDKKEFSLLLDLPEDIQSKIFTYLQARDIAHLRRVNSSINNRLENDDAMARAWYRQLAPSHRTRLETIVATKDKDELQKWLKRFTKDEALIKSIMDRQESIHFPALFFSTLTKLMCQCKAFQLETKATIPCNTLKDLASFSADGRHLVIACDSKTCKIYDQESNESWLPKGTISHDEKVRSVTFSANSRYIVTAGMDGKAKIYGKKDEQSWEEKATISHDQRVKSATFSPDSRHVITCGIDNTVKIHGLTINGSWKEKAIISNDDDIRLATFSLDGRHVVTASFDRTVKIYGQNSDGSWGEKATSSHPGGLVSATFSINGHVLTIHGDNTAKITELRMDD
ncbi:F-box/WD repeat-containing protein [Endozoicomonas sp. ALB032]|uniref:F-box/WD repeat-containing protein n=1 Tax=Endozoicomonas sp. ALB032 TaxID=3403082 RepID=UPI003BB65039